MSAQPQDKYVVRLPDGLRGRIKAHAERSGRSMNTEIVRVLEEAFPALMAEPVIHFKVFEKLVDGDNRRTIDIMNALSICRETTLIVPDEMETNTRLRGHSLIFGHFDRIVTESGTVLKCRISA